jgi:hypothetical protein
LVFPFQPGALCHALQSVVAAEEPHFSPAFLFKGYALTALCASPTLSRTATPPHPHTPPNIFPPLHPPPHTLHIAPPAQRLLPAGGEAPRSPAIFFLKRAVTTSIGTLSLGALVEALVGLALTSCVTHVMRHSVSH